MDRLLPERGRPRYSEAVTEIGFYHLTRTGPDQALPSLLGRTLASGERAVVLCGSEARVSELDRALWECEEPDWLPHGSARSGNAELQPIWLTTAEERPNGARFLFLLDGREADLASWTRVFDLFDGGSETEVAAARRRWTAAKAGGHALTYWRQGERGWSKG
jgi:DNA polymerase-3 subunit chi